MTLDNPIIRQELNELLKENEKLIKKNQMLDQKIQVIEKEKRLAFEELEKLQKAFHNILNMGK